MISTLVSGFELRFQAWVILSMGNKLDSWSPNRAIGIQIRNKVLNMSYGFKLDFNLGLEFGNKVSSRCWCSKRGLGFEMLVLRSTVMCVGGQLKMKCSNVTQNHDLSVALRSNMDRINQNRMATPTAKSTANK